MDDHSLEGVARGGGGVGQSEDGGCFLVHNSLTGSTRVFLSSHLEGVQLRGNTDQQPADFLWASRCHMLILVMSSSENRNTE